MIQKKHNAYSASKTRKQININMIAPCGMNGAICSAHIREEYKCSGCRIRTNFSYCRKCIIKHCKELKKLKTRFCFECEKYPCQRLKQLDKRYRARYHMSMLENLEYISRKGIDKFVKKEVKRWRCKNCGNLLSCHKNVCLVCGVEVFQ